MSIDKDDLISALLPHSEDGWRVNRPNDAAPLLALCTRQRRWERALLGGRLPLRGPTRYELLCLFHVELLDFNSLAQCLDTAAQHLARRLANHTGPARARLSTVILCDRALPDALERLENTRPATGCKSSARVYATAHAVAAELGEGQLTLSPGARALGRSTGSALRAGEADRTV